MNYTRLCTITNLFAVLFGVCVASASAANVVLEYRNNSYGDQVIIKPDILLHNTTSSSLQLSDITLRYWYSNETASAQVVPVFHVLNSGTWQSPCNYPFSCVTHIVSAKADNSYVELGFSEAAGNLLPGKYINLQFAIHADNWASFVQENDYSFAESTGNYQAWNKISVYSNGSLIYGTEPQSQPSACSQMEPEVLGYSWSPAVIDVAQSNSVSFTARILGAATNAELCLSNSPSAACSENLALVGPDENCNYSVELSTNLALQYHNLANNLHRPVVGFLKTLDKTINVFANVYTPDIPQCTLTAVASWAQQCSKVVNLALPEVFSDYVSLSTAKRESISQAFYELFGDNYDFLTVVSVSRSYIQNASYLGVKNEIAGIGATLFDRTSKFGSDGRLRGNIVFPTSQFFDGAANVFSHEISHAWMNFNNLPLLGQTSPHWPISDLANGILGFSLPSGQGGQFTYVLDIVDGIVQKTVDPNPKAFKDLALYLMGVLPADQVSNHFVMDDAGNPNNFPSANFTEFTIDDVISANGVRQPAYPNEASDFRVATVLVSEDLLSQQAMALFNYYAARMESTDDTVLTKQGLSPLSPHRPFYSATGGRATLEATID